MNLHQILYQHPWSNKTAAKVKLISDASSPSARNQRTGDGQRLQPFFLLATKSRGWYRFTLNRLVSLGYLRCVPIWRAPGGTRTHVSGNCWVRLSERTGGGQRLRLQPLQLNLRAQLIKSLGEQHELMCAWLSMPVDRRAIHDDQKLLQKPAPVVLCDWLWLG